MTMNAKSRFFLSLAGIFILILMGPGFVCAQSMSLPTAQFAGSVTQGQAPLVVKFTDTSISSGTTSYKWEFINEAGRVTSTSALKNPTVTYTTLGTKTVKLTVTNASGSNTDVKTNYINVLPVSESTISGSTPSSITVTSPNGGETLKQSPSPQITWDYTGSPGSTVKIELLKGGSVSQTLSASTPNDGTFTSWTIPSTLVAGTDYRIRITSTTNSAITDSSNNYFTISSGTTSNTGTTPISESTPSSITVTAPNGADTWMRGTTKTVTWDYTGNPGSTMKIVLMKGTTEVGTIKDSTSIGSGGKGSYTWPISASGTTGSDYKVSVQSISQPTIKDTSDNYFAISSGTSSTPSPTPSPSSSPSSSITVTSPDRGETLKKGTSPQITWEYTGSPGSAVKIELLKGSSVSQTLSASTSNDGTFTSWTIPSTFASGTDYRIRITSTTNTAITDTSNNYFTITSGTSSTPSPTPTPSPSSSITVTSPDRGETLKKGTSPQITWEYTGSPGSAVKIEPAEGKQCEPDAVCLHLQRRHLHQLDHSLHFSIGDGLSYSDYQYDQYRNH